MAKEPHQNDDSEQPETDLSKERLRLWLQMLKAVRSAEARLRERLRTQYESTLPRFDVLATLHSAPDGLRMSELSQLLNVSNSNVTGVVERLVKDGLLYREAQAGDRRVLKIGLTHKGLVATNDMIASHREWIDDILMEVDEADARHAITTMQAVRRGAKR
jgi:DNA-binding MarR family transcriptional regulator